MHEATVCRIVRKVETALIRSGLFELPGKKQLLDPNFVAALVVIDATETPIERPKKGQKRFYSGKKKRHTQRYRNRRKRFGLRFNLIVGLYNYELGLFKPD